MLSCRDLIHSVHIATKVIPMYWVEIALSKHRGVFNIGYHLCLSFGMLLATSVNFGTEKIEGGWKCQVSIAVIAFPAFIIDFGLFFLNTKEEQSP